MNKQDKNKMKLAGLQAHMTANPNKDKGVQSRVLFAIEDATSDGLTDKQYADYYTHARRIATRYGYAEYLTQGRMPTENPVLSLAFAHISQSINEMITNNANHPAFAVLRRKKNKAGLISHTRSSLVKSMIASCQRWHTAAYENGTWDGSVEGLISIGTIENSPALEDA